MPPQSTCGVVAASWLSSSWGALSSLASTRWTSWERSLGFLELPPRLSGPPTPLWWVHDEVLDSGIVWSELVHSLVGFHVICRSWRYSLVWLGSDHGMIILRWGRHSQCSSLKVWILSWQDLILKLSTFSRFVFLMFINCMFTLFTLTFYHFYFDFVVLN